MPAFQHREQEPHPLRIQGYKSSDAFLASSDDEEHYAMVPVAPTAEHPANLVGSMCTDGFHRPALDIDLPAMLVESSTPGHHHLYISRPMTWEQYERLLDVLEEVGICQPGFVRMAKQRRGTWLRLPGVTKADTNGGSEA